MELKARVFNKDLCSFIYLTTKLFCAPSEIIILPSTLQLFPLDCDQQFVALSWEDVHAINMELDTVVTKNRTMFFQ